MLPHFSKLFGFLVINHFSSVPFPFSFSFFNLIFLFYKKILSYGLCILLQFNCFLLMPVVDKLPALLREDLESAFEDDLDNIFDISNLRHSLGQRKRDTEIELKRVCN